jgi:hypothetical protein
VRVRSGNERIGQEEQDSGVGGFPMLFLVAKFKKFVDAKSSHHVH